MSNESMHRFSAARQRRVLRRRGWFRVRLYLSALVGVWLLAMAAGFLEKAGRGL